MLRTTSPNLSIITNFGCRADCWYCIWKKHPLKDVNEPVDWLRLSMFIRRNRSKGKFSVSGGGDCLRNYAYNIEFWDSILELASQNEMVVDIHSRERFLNCEFWSDPIINKLVFSADEFTSAIADYLLWARLRVKVRLVHVVTEFSTLSNIQRMEDFCIAQNMELTLKQLSGFDDNGMYEQARKEFPDLFFLDEGDYNIYYMPDNTITESFLPAVEECFE